MKTEISRDSHRPEKRYSGVYQQQGRMLTDADWNELVEILKERLNDALKDVVGNKAGSMGGTPRHRALKVVDEAPEIFKIKPGHIYVDGVEAQIPGDTTILYNAQSDFPSPPPTPTDDCVLYADVWERTVTHLMDERLRDKGLHGADTCTRKQTMVQVKWCPKTVDPEQSAKNPPKGDAELSLKLLQTSTQPDPCDPCAAQLDVESKTGNYLFRVEVHDVQGEANDPSEITLKWSSENGAEQFEALPTKEEMPAGFISDKWIYEFFDKTSEKHLGVHLAPDFTPSREELKEGYPDTVPTRSFVRRWDGYCTLDLSSKTLIKGMDRGVTLSTSKASDAPGYVKIDSSLQIILASVKFDMVLDGKKFGAGDYWLADVREAEHDPLDPEKSKLIESETPQGIEHHYLTLGNVAGGTLQPNSEMDRKYAFPSLTEMTRMFHVGGDGQEAMPEHELPQPIEVGVANGEWPVNGASVRFTIEAGADGALSLTQGSFGTATTIVNKSGPDNGVAKCYWKLGDGINPHSKEQRVKAELLGPDGSTPLDHPPLYFNANLSTADQVAYDNPNCADSPSVNSLLEADLTPSWPDFDNDGNSTVKDVLDVLLCKLKAKHIPYDPTLTAKRWEDINEINANLPDNVQNAIDQLVNNLEASDIRYVLPLCEITDYGVPTFKKLIEENIAIEAGETNPKIKAVWDAVLCLLDAKHTPYDYQKEADRWEEVIDERSWNDFTEGYSLEADWVKTFGGDNADYIRGAAVDSYGNVVLTGTFSGTINFGGEKLVSESDSAIFLVKLKPTGEHIWSKKFETRNSQASGQSVIVDSRQNIILVASVTYSGGEGISRIDNTVGKLSAEGEHLWASRFIGQETSFGYTAAIDSDDNVIVSGFFQGEIKYGIREERVLNSVGKADIFLAKLRSDDGQVEWANNYGGEEYDVGHNVGVDTHNNIILTGFFQGTINFGEDTPEINSQGKSDIFVAKFEPNYGKCLWARQYGGTLSDYGRGLVLDENNDIYLTGCFQKEITFGYSNDVLKSEDGYDVYIAKLSGNGEHIWSRSFPGTKSDFGHAVTITTDGTVALVGYFAGQVNFGGRDLVSQGETDAFLALFNPEGHHLFSESIGGTGADMSTRLAAGPDNSLVIAGIYRGNINIAGIELNSAEQSDVFVARFFPPYKPPTTVQSAIDLLLTELDSSDIAYQLPSCSNAIDSIRKRLFPVDDNSTVRDVLNALLCMLDASTIPHDRNTNTGSLIDGFVDKSGDSMTGDLSVNGTVTATEFEGDGSALTGISAGKWSEGVREIIYYNSGNVGIGTIMPVFKLHIKGDFYIEDDVWPEILFNKTNGKTWRVGHDGDDFRIRVWQGSSIGYKDRIVATYEGNVGIGEKNPSYPLHVNQEISNWQSRFTNGTANVYLNHASGYGMHINTGHNNSSTRYALQVKNAQQTHLYIRDDGNIGIGTTSPTHKLEVHGNLWVRNWTTVGSDYAEYFESQDGKAISAGTAVVIENGKARRANKNETPLGIVSANPGMAGGVHVEWPKKYLRDEFGSLIMEEYQDEIMAPKKDNIKKERHKVKKKTIEVEETRTEIVFEKKKYCQKEITETVTREIEEPVFKEVDLYDVEGKNKIGRHKIPVMETYEEEIEVLDEDGQPVLVGTGEFATEQRPKLNPDYDESKEYISREQRPEWNCVGLLGQLHLRKGQPVAPTWIKIKDISDEVELWLVK
jgi:hypothetical protein